MPSASGRNDAADAPDAQVRRRATSRAGCGATADPAARSSRSRSGSSPAAANAAPRVLEHRGDRVVVGARQPSGARQRSERRPALDGQRVRRHVLGREPDRARRRRAASRRTTARGRRTSDRSTRCRTPPRARPARRPARPPRRGCGPSPRSNRSSNACTPIDSRLTPLAAQRAQLRLVDLARVDLDGDLQRRRRGRRRRTPRAPRRSPARARPRATAPACRRRSRSTTSGPAPSNQRRARRDLGDHGVGVRVVRDAGARVDREVAVRAAHAAEREMDVDAERLAGPQRAGRHIAPRAPRPPIGGSPPITPPACSRCRRW